jgi:hypothetical protein
MLLSICLIKSVTFLILPLPLCFYFACGPPCLLHYRDWPASHKRLDHTDVEYGIYLYYILIFEAKYAEFVTPICYPVTFACSLTTSSVTAPFLTFTCPIQMSSNFAPLSLLTLCFFSESIFNRAWLIGLTHIKEKLSKFCWLAATQLTDYVHIFTL